MDAQEQGVAFSMTGNDRNRIINKIASLYGKAIKFATQGEKWDKFEQDLATLCQALSMNFIARDEPDTAKKTMHDLNIDGIKIWTQIHDLFEQSINDPTDK